MGLKPQFNGAAAVEVKNLWGVIDKSGNWVVQPTYTHIRDISLVK